MTIPSSVGLSTYKPVTTKDVDQVKQQVVNTIKQEIPKVPSSISTPVKSAISSLSSVSDSISGVKADVDRIKKLASIDTEIHTSSSSSSDTMSHGTKITDSGVSGHAEVAHGSASTSAEFNGAKVDANAHGKLLSVKGSANLEDGLHAEVSVAHGKASASATIGGKGVEASVEAGVLSARAGINSEFVGASATLGKVSTGVDVAGVGSFGVGLTAGAGFEINPDKITVSLGVEITIPNPAKLIKSLWS